MENVPVHIRRARTADLETLTQIAHAAKAHWGYPAAWLQLWKADLTFTEATLDQHYVFCAERAGTIEGVYALSQDGASGEIEHLWVDPEYIGQGLGRILFDHALHQARALGIQQLDIVADPYAEGFYAKMGARRIGDWPSVPEGRVLPLMSMVV